MNTAFLLIIFVPLFEIYLFIKIGSYLGAFNTITLVLLTAIIGVWYARYEGFNTLKSGIKQLMKNELPLYEIVSGAALTFAAILMIFPGFATDILGLLLIFPITRKIFLRKVSQRYQKDKNNYKSQFIEGESEDLDDKK
tara:strand:+ start:229 stop:645 length:417 start_codon:yes stop_codon:yes gene_type:complete